MQPPHYTNPQQYQQMPPQPPSYWTGKHVTGALILAGSMGTGVLFFLFGFALVLPYYRLSYVVLIGLQDSRKERVP